RSLTETFHGKKSEAQKRLRELLSRRDKEDLAKPEKITVRQYFESWIEKSCKPNLGPDSTQTYRSICNAHIYPTLGSKRMTALKSKDIQDLEDEKLKTGRLDGKGGLSNRTVKYIHITLNKGLKAAVKKGLLLRNPCDGVEPPKMSQKHDFKILNEDQINTLLEALEKSEYYPLFFTDMFSGMRRSELLALRWCDVDLLGMTASVNRVIKVLKGGIIEYQAPKTPKSRRLIALTPANVIVLRDHLAARKQFLKSLDPNFDPDKDFDQNELVFCFVDGNRPYLPDSITHVWMELVKQHGLPGVRLHDVRHTHATLLLKQGIHPKVVQERLGHSRISTTLDTYSHIVPGLQEAAAAGFDKILKPKKTKMEKELTEIIQK
ncbi:MAG: tyrosine-type recombinase/integrase, partial [Dehalococcoidales bacterium]|nr:tyrosine-type recombinase/integrase [Dehalococcoidales bacterium]